MPKKNKFFLLIFGEFIFLFFILLIFPTVFLQEKPGISQTNFENILPLNRNHSYTQKIVSDRNNLSSVSVLIKNPRLLSHDSVNIYIQDQSKDTLKSLTITGFSIGDPSWINFKFPIINSKIGDTFYINITSNSLDDDSLYIYGDTNTNNINFKTTFTAKNFKESFQNNLKEQITKFHAINKTFLYIYISIILITNVLIFLYYEPKKN